MVAVGRGAKVVVEVVSECRPWRWQALSRERVFCGCQGYDARRKCSGSAVDTKPRRAEDGDSWQPRPLALSSLSLHTRPSCARGSLRFWGSMCLCCLCRPPLTNGAGLCARTHMLARELGRAELLPFYRSGLPNPGRQGRNCRNETLLMELSD